MKKRSKYIKNLFLPCVGFSTLAGIGAAGLVFCFKLIANKVISATGECFASAGERPWLIPVIILAAAVLGLLSALLLRAAPDCRGGGIPTVVASLRGLISFSWIKSALLLPLSALITFACGVPLGNEGPCVQMGAAVGEGAVSLGGKGQRAWRRYIMTGGACAGFAVATGSPIAGIFFAVEEAHRRLSPMIFMTASISVMAGQATMLALCSAFGLSNAMFDLALDVRLPLSLTWSAIPVGIVCGFCAIIFARAYRACGGLLKGVLGKVPFTVKVVGIFVITAALGLVSVDFIGSGHALIERIIHGDGIWYMLAICFLVRALLLMLANNSGVTGGLFIPTLTFGAILGSLCAGIFVSVGVIDAQYRVVLVIVGMTSFLGASSRIPMTACVFALEALCGMDNIFPVAVGVTVALLIIETAKEPVFSDAVIDAKLEAKNEGKTARIFDVFLTVKEGAFVVEKEIRDILWPPTCTVLSIERSSLESGAVGLSVGDVLHVHYQSHEPHETFDELEALVGRQADDVRMKVHLASMTHTVPDNS